MELDANLCENTYNTTNSIPIQAIEYVEPTSDLLQDCSHVCTRIASGDEQDIDGLLDLIPEPYCTPVVEEKTLTTRVDAKTILFDHPRLPQDAQDESSSFTEPPYTFLILQDSSGLPLSRVDQCERDMYTAMAKKLVYCLKDGLTSGHIALDMRNKTNLEMDRIIWNIVMNSIELRKFLLDIPSLYAKETHTCTIVTIGQNTSVVWTQHS